MKKRPAKAPETPLSKASEGVPLPETPSAFPKSAETAGNSQDAKPRGPGRPPGAETKRCAICSKTATDCRCKGGPYLDKPKFEISETFFRYGMMLVSQFCASAVSLSMKIPYTDAIKIWNFEAPEIANLYGPGHKVIEKWLPFWLIMYQDEIALAVVLMPILTAKMVATGSLRQQLEEKKLAAAAEETEKKPQAEVIQ